MGERESEQQRLHSSMPPWEYERLVDHLARILPRTDLHTGRMNLILNANSVPDSNEGSP